jgi:hypothetical protein
MSDFDEKLRLKEKAEEDRYFARKNRELIQALHEERAQENQAQEQLADPSPVQPESTTAGSDQAHEKPSGYPRKLIARVLRCIKSDAR